MSSGRVFGSGAILHEAAWRGDELRSSPSASSPPRAAWGDIPKWMCSRPSPLAVGGPFRTDEADGVVSAPFPRGEASGPSGRSRSDPESSGVAACDVRCRSGEMAIGQLESGHRGSPSEEVGRGSSGAILGAPAGGLSWLCGSGGIVGRVTMGDGWGASSGAPLGSGVSAAWAGGSGAGRW